MRFPRVKAFTTAFSRVVECRFIFQISGHRSVEVERFVTLMRRLETFSGVRVLTYVLMFNQIQIFLASSLTPTCYNRYITDTDFISSFKLPYKQFTKVF